MLTPRDRGLRHTGLGVGLPGRARESPPGGNLLDPGPQCAVNKRTCLDVSSCLGTKEGERSWSMLSMGTSWQAGLHQAEGLELGGQARGA